MLHVSDKSVLVFRELKVPDLDSLVRLGEHAWWMRTRSREVVEGLLLQDATKVYGLFDGGRLVASGALLTDGLTKAVLVDVVVDEAYRRGGCGRLLVEKIMETVPDHIEGILYCRKELEGMYVQHGFRIDDSYSLMLRR